MGIFIYYGRLIMMKFKIMLICVIVLIVVSGCVKKWLVMLLLVLIDSIIID